MNRRLFFINLIASNQALASFGDIETNIPTFQILEFNDRGLYCTSDRHFFSSKLKTTEEEMLFEKLDHKTFHPLRQYSVFNKKIKIGIEQESKYILYVHSQRYHNLFYFENANNWYQCKNDLFDICRHFEIDVKIVKAPEDTPYYPNFFEGF